MERLYVGGMVITMNPKGEIIPNGGIYVKDDRIKAVGTAAELTQLYPDVPRQDVSGRALLPGFVNIHSHSNLAGLKGLAEDVSTYTAVYGMMPTFRACLDEEGMYNVSLNGLVEMVTAGTTTVAETSPLKSAEAVRDVGVRAVFGAGMVFDYEYDQIRYGKYIHNPSLGEQGLLESERIFSLWHGAENGRIRCMLYPHATETCSPDVLRGMKALSDRFDAVVTTHLAQNYKEVDRIASFYGMSPVQYLDHCGVLNEKFIGAHCVYLSEADYRLMAERGAHFAHCPLIINKRGYAADTTTARRLGVNIGLGTDNMFADMTETMRYVLTNTRIRTGDTTLIGPYEALDMATMGGARALGMADEIGSLEAGKLADLIMIDLDQPHLSPATAETVVSVLVYNACGHDVVCSIVGGRTLFERGAFSIFDEKAVSFAAQRSAEKAWVDFDKFF